MNLTRLLIMGLGLLALLLSLLFLFRDDAPQESELKTQGAMGETISDAESLRRSPTKLTREPAQVVMRTLEIVVRGEGHGTLGIQAELSLEGSDETQIRELIAADERRVAQGSWALQDVNSFTTVDTYGDGAKAPFRTPFPLPALSHRSHLQRFEWSLPSDAVGRLLLRASDGRALGEAQSFAFADGDSLALEYESKDRIVTIDFVYPLELRHDYSTSEHVWIDGVLGAIPVEWASPSRLRFYRPRDRLDVAFEFEFSPFEIFSGRGLIPADRDDALIVLKDRVRVVVELEAQSGRAFDPELMQLRYRDPWSGVGARRLGDRFVAGLAEGRHEVELRLREAPRSILKTSPDLVEVAESALVIRLVFDDSGLELEKKAGGSLVLRGLEPGEAYLQRYKPNALEKAQVSSSGVAHWRQLEPGRYYVLQDSAEPYRPSMPIEIMSGIEQALSYAPQVPLGWAFYERSPGALTQSPIEDGDILRGFQGRSFDASYGPKDFFEATISSGDVEFLQTSYLLEFERQGQTVVVNIMGRKLYNYGMGGYPVYEKQP